MVAEKVQKRNAVIDLVIIAGVSVISMGAAMESISMIRVLPVFQKLLAMAGMQFCIAGLGPLIVFLIRKESLRDYCIKKRNLFKSVVLGLVFGLFVIIGTSISNGELTWIPLKKIDASKWVCLIAFPLNIVGVVITVVAWGVAESFTWIAFSKKVSDIGEFFPFNPWLSTGPVVIALLNGFMHMAMGQGIAGMAVSSVSAYLVAVTPKLTRNAWGGIVFQTLTNGLGK